MAKVQERRRSDGEISFRVMWVIGGGRARGGAAAGEPGSQASETFTDTKLMTAFKAAVELQGHRWPKGWVKGRSWVDDDPAGSPEPVTLGDVHAAWLGTERRKIALKRKKPDSVGRDEKIYQQHIAPILGERPFVSITRTDIDAWVSRMAAGGAAASAIGNRHGVLHSIMSYGTREMSLRVDNPCIGTALPREEHNRQLGFFTHGEWALIRRCLRSDVHLMVDAALATGVRWGELSALRVGDVTRQPGEEAVLTIHITRAWSRRNPAFDTDPIRPEQGETVRHKIGPTKTRKDRWVQVYGDLAERLYNSLIGKGQENYLFTTARGNPWRYEDFHTDRWTAAVVLAHTHGLTKTSTFHMLRHTFVVWLLADGESLPVISTRLGHASIQITMDRYGGLLDLHDAGTARRMARQLACAQTAILPVNLRADVDARPIRPGRRGERRLRTAG